MFPWFCLELCSRRQWLAVHRRSSHWSNFSTGGKLSHFWTRYKLPDRWPPKPIRACSLDATFPRLARKLLVKRRTTRSFAQLWVCQINSYLGRQSRIGVHCSRTWFLLLLLPGQSFASAWNGRSRLGARKSSDWTRSESPSHFSSHQRYRYLWLCVYALCLSIAAVF